jgi:hypothetical protein
VLPLLPIIVIGAIEQHPLGLVAVAAGLAHSFATTGVPVASAELSLGIDSSTLRATVAGLMIALGLVLLLPSWQMALTAAAAQLTAGGNNLLGRLPSRASAGNRCLAPCSEHSGRPAPAHAWCSHRTGRPEQHVTKRCAVDADTPNAAQLLESRRQRP